MNNNCTSAHRSGSLHFTQKTDYGLILLSELAKEKEAPLSQIAESKALSFLFLQKVARSLLKSGLIRAKRGKYGGYSLQKSPSKITLKEIVEALEGKISVAPCIAAGTCKKSHLCGIRKKMQNINREIEQIILSKKLDYFLND